MKLAMERAVEHYGPVDHAVYVGDGVWDARASRELNMPFIGIGKGTKAQRLEQEGAVLVMPDYLDPKLTGNSPALLRFARGQFCA